MAVYEDEVTRLITGAQQADELGTGGAAEIAHG
jgi:hypothetical protein